MATLGRTATVLVQVLVVIRVRARSGEQISLEPVHHRPCTSVRQTTDKKRRSGGKEGGKPPDLPVIGKTDEKSCP